MDLNGAPAAPQRIAILGCGGAGKLSLARRLGERLGLPVVHRDTVFGTAGWKPLESEARRARQATICAEPRWILDAPAWTCLARVWKRDGAFRGSHRPDETVYVARTTEGAERLLDALAPASGSQDLPGRG